MITGGAVRAVHRSGDLAEQGENSPEQRGETAGGHSPKRPRRRSPRPPPGKARDDRGLGADGPNTPHSAPASGPFLGRRPAPDEASAGKRSANPPGGIAAKLRTGSQVCAPLPGSFLNEPSHTCGRPPVPWGAISPPQHRRGIQAAPLRPRPAAMIQPTRGSRRIRVALRLTPAASARTLAQGNSTATTIRNSRHWRKGDDVAVRPAARIGVGGRRKTRTSPSAVQPPHRARPGIERPRDASWSAAPGGPRCRAKGIQDGRFRPPDQPSGTEGQLKAVERGSGPRLP